MSIYRFSGKNTEIFEEYELYTQFYKENIVGKTNYTSNTQINLTSNVKVSPPLNLSPIYVKIRIPPPPSPTGGVSTTPTTPPAYDGQFGFDFIDVDPESEVVSAIQDVGVAEAEYFYYKSKTAPVGDLGDIVQASTYPDQFQQAIIDHYKISNASKYVDMPYLLMLPDPNPNKTVTLEMEVVVAVASATFPDDYITIVDDDYYTFEIDGATKTDKTSKKKIVGKEKILLKIKCLKEAPEKLYFIQHENSTHAMVNVGGLCMMENKVLKLKFRVIALVSKDGTETAKAISLLQKFVNANIIDYLNNNSLNQAGYEVEIENMNDLKNLTSSNVDDYFYAFDKTDWTTKKYFSNITKQKYDVIPGTNTCKSGSVDASGNCKKVPVSTDVITEEDDIDNVAFGLYQEKLKKKTPSKTYEGGVIILVDFESPSDTSAFSRTDPLNNYKVFVYSTSTGEKDHYAHEIGHMLGLPHLFFDTKEKDAYKIARENILGNGKPETIIKDGKNVPNPECILPIDEQINKSLTDTNYYIRTEVYAKKSTIKRQLQLSINYFTAEKSNEQRDKTRIETAFRGQPDTVIVARSGTKTQTKGVYIGLCNTKIIQYTNYLNDNNIAMSEINALIDNDKIKKHRFKMIFKASHYTAILRESNVYYKNVINQIHSNYLMFIQGKTKNIMDYHNERIVFLHNQIKVMRDDSANY